MFYIIPIGIFLDKKILVHFTWRNAFYNRHFAFHFHLNEIGYKNIPIGIILPTIFLYELLRKEGSAGNYRNACSLQRVVYSHTPVQINPL